MIELWFRAHESPKLQPYCVLAVSTGAEAAGHAGGDVGDAVARAHGVPLLCWTGAVSVTVGEEHFCVIRHTRCPAGPRQIDTCSGSGLKSFEWLLLSLENIFCGAQHWPVVWHSEPSYGDVIALGAKLQQQEEVGHEWGGEGELSSGHQTQFVPLHQQPAEEDAHRHRWQVQYTWMKRVWMFRHGEVSAAESLSLHPEVFCFDSFWTVELSPCMAFWANRFPLWCDIPAL